MLSLEDEAAAVQGGMSSRCYRCFLVAVEHKSLLLIAMSFSKLWKRGRCTKRLMVGLSGHLEARLFMPLHIGDGHGIEHCDLHFTPHSRQVAWFSQRPAVRFLCFDVSFCCQLARCGVGS